VSVELADVQIVGQGLVKEREVIEEVASIVQVV
jgi:hypothetical protein